MISILNIGCRFYKSDPQKTGGVVVLFEQWLEFCSTTSGKYRFETIDSNKNNYKNKLIALFSIIRNILGFCIRNPSTKILFLHATYFDIMVISPFLFLCKHIFNVKVVMRKFGGNFDEIFYKSNKLKQKFIKYIISSFDLSFWESKRLVRFGRRFNNRTCWFPNVRIPSEVKRDPKRKFEHRLVFISRVQKEKGILELVKAVSTLGHPYSLDIFGPISGVDIKELNSHNVFYKGALSPNEISRTLANYDILCLPTYWNGEGYPGIIIEAFSVGIPVISTYKGGIPELVKNENNGILIERVDIESIMAGILKIDSNNYSLIAKNAEKSFASFNANIVNNDILKIITTTIET